MKSSKIVLAVISIILVFSLTFNFTGCTMKVHAENLMKGIIPNKADNADLAEKNAAVTDFAVRLFKKSEKNGENTLISPLSVLCALGLAANGAEGRTLDQIENIIGMDIDELNLYLHTYMNNLPQGEKYKLSLANSVWFTDDKHLSVNKEFLQTNANYYSADIYKTPFNEKAKKDINNWIKNKTDGMIPKILNEIPKDTVMYLINSLAFEAEWGEIYERQNVKNGEFTKENGEKQKADFMYGNESIYLEDENATGFIKYYKDKKYAFAALLPNEDISVSDYINALSGEKLNEMLNAPQYTAVYTAIPKFETQFSADMSEILKNMGMPKAFDAENAEFERLGTYKNGNIYIGKVLHKTFISVGEKGTKAGAVTVIDLRNKSSAEPEEPKIVYLTRPFVYMLIDCENNIPFFIGTMMET